MVPRQKSRFRLGLICSLTLACLLNGCATNPVTGESEVSFISTTQELEIGRSQYRPGRQMSGGDYVADPAIQAYVEEVGLRIARVSDRELPYEFTVVNDSTPNAWALPGGKIAIHRGLLTELNSEAELAAVLSHEIIHAAARHGAKRVERGMLLQGALITTAVLTQNDEYGTLLMTGSGLAAQLLTQKYGRDAEREADQYGMLYMSRAGYDPQAAVDLQDTFVRLSQGRDPNWLEGMFSSHPPSRERVARNRETATTLPTGGEYGRERYQQAVAGLLETRPAYEAHDRGRKALAEGDLDTALREASFALNAEPREPIFHILRGDVRLAQKRYGDAIVNFDRAMDRYPGYFYTLMRRGMAHRALGNDTDALLDLEESVLILPTAEAMNSLGELRLQMGDREGALEMFSRAAASDSPAGRAATRSLLGLELSDNPGRYLQTRVGLDDRGTVIVEVRNTTSVPIDVLEVGVGLVNANGRTSWYPVRFAARVPPRQAVRRSSGYGPLNSQQLPNLRVGVSKARVSDSD